MNYRTATILAEKSLSGTGTETIPINIQDVISRILLTWRITKKEHTMTGYPHQDITKIALVDGSDVLFSMDGGQAQALNIYDRLCPTMNYGQHMDENSQLANFAIDFGRFLHDPELALDPQKFRNPVLKVSYNVAVSDTAVAEGNLAVFAEVFDEKVVSPVGFLMSKEHHSRTPPASGYWYVDLPTDYPIRKLLVQGYRAAFEPWYQVSEARLDEDNEKRIPFDWVLETYYRMMIGVWKPVEELAISRVVGTPHDTYATPTDYWATINYDPQTHNPATQYTKTDRGGKFSITTMAALGQYSALISGYLPNHCFEFPFGLPQDMADWYDVTRVGSLRLRLKAGTGAANGTVAAILQQLRRY